MNEILKAFKVPCGGTKTNFVARVLAAFDAVQVVAAMGSLHHERDGTFPRPAQYMSGSYMALCARAVAECSGGGCSSANPRMELEEYARPLHNLASCAVFVHLVRATQHGRRVEMDGGMQDTWKEHVETLSITTTSLQVLCCGATLFLFPVP